MRAAVCSALILLPACALLSLPNVIAVITSDMIDKLHHFSLSKGKLWGLEEYWLESRETSPKTLFVVA